MSSKQQPSPLKYLSCYQLRECVYETSWENVYHARDSRSGELVTLKMIPSELPAEVRQRLFRNERDTLATVKHPNIVRLVEAREERGLLYLVVEHLDGPNLEKTIADRQPMNLREKLEPVAQVADALHCAHQHGIVHRTLLPLEIVVTGNGVAKLHGFHMREIPGSPCRESASDGTIVGKPRYPSPEQIRGGNVDARSDIFSLGTILYQLLTYALPFPGDDVTTVLYKIVAEPPEPLGKHLPDAPQELAAIVNKALAKDRAQRYQSAEAMARELRALARTPRA